MSLNVDPSTWRLETDEGIKYKLINPSPSGSANQESESAHEEYIIQAKDLTDFIDNSFPKMLLSGKTWGVSTGRAFPGNLSLKTTNISWTGFDSGRPSDPFGSDPDYPLPDNDKTYCKFIKLTIDYGGSESSNDTLMEVSADASGEFMTLPVHNKNAEIVTPGGGNDFPVEDVDMPVSKLIPTTAWTVRYPKLAQAALKPLIAACKWSMGTLNDAPMPIFFNAAKETILFLGYSYNEEFSLRNEPIAFNLKFLEKNIGIDDAGNAIGHNFHYVPEEGKFMEVKVNANQYTYYISNLNALILL